MVWWGTHGVRIDRVTLEVHAALADRGIASILLKGPSIAAWLYGLGELRRYGDSDFLIRRADWDRAGDVLRGLGFAPKWDEGAHRGLGSYSSFPWQRDDEAVDLHATLSGLGAAHADVWAILSSATVPQQILDADIPVLAPAPRAMHVALHAAQHHRFQDQPRRDLEKAVATVPTADWREALAIAERLDGVAALAAGLRLVDGGHELATELGVLEVSTVETRLREEWVPLAEGMNALLETPGLRAKLRTGLHEVVPSPAFMRWWSPLARRGPVGLLAAYLWRPVWLATRLPGALRAVRRARR